MGQSTLDNPLLAIDDLRVTFNGSRAVPAVRGVSFTVHSGETVAVLGESGCGKTATARAVMGLLAPGTGVTGRIGYRGENLLDLPAARRRSMGGKEIAMVFQDAQSALNPAYPVGAQIAETFRVHRGTRKRDALNQAVELIERVGIPDPVRRARQYPHQLSGGLRQRVIIAMAVALGPSVLLADEPTTALDVTVQAQILALLRDMQREYRTALVLITHDLAAAAQIAGRAVVMYAGQVVETGPLRRVYQRPAHPYTAALLQSVPRVDQRVAELGRIPGSPPDPAALPAGCPFAPRCALADDRCRTEAPQLRVLAVDTSAACHYAEVTTGG